MLKSLSNTATEMSFNEKVKTRIETRENLKIYLGNTKTNTFLFGSQYLILF